MENSPLPNRKFRTTDAAGYCGMAKSTLEKLRVTGGGPPYLKIGRTVVYNVVVRQLHRLWKARRTAGELYVDWIGG